MVLLDRAHVWTHYSRMTENLPGQLELPIPEPQKSDAAVLRGVVGLVTPAELASALGMSEHTLSVWRCTSQGPDFVKLGKGVFYQLRDIQAWVSQSVTSVVTGGKAQAV
jgi:predicted DNA-binding transcriptional regulator AlpA